LFKAGAVIWPPEWSGRNIHQEKAGLPDDIAGERRATNRRSDQMGQQSNQAMAKIGTTFFWTDLRRQQQRNRSDHIERAPVVGEALIEDDLATLYPRSLPPRVDGVEEDFHAAERRATRQRKDNEPSGKVLAIASLLVIVVVAALLGLTLAV
jgi:Flp pilus assembly protein TadB